MMPQESWTKKLYFFLSSSPNYCVHSYLTDEQKKYFILQWCWPNSRNLIDPNIVKQSSKLAPSSANLHAEIFIN